MVRDARDLRGAPGSYAAIAHLDIEAIYLNADWLTLVTPSALGDVVAREVGRALGQRLQGDAGTEESSAAFALTVSAFALEARSAARNAMHAALRGVSQGT